VAGGGLKALSLAMAAFIVGSCKLDVSGGKGKRVVASIPVPCRHESLRMGPGCSGPSGNWYIPSREGWYVPLRLRLAEPLTKHPSSF